ncbi:MAG: LysM peptidoglycan-binding domain-containing protein [Bacteroidia bacterium]|nr:MAG: LysM peptidoglycan-binding domain-containing protein [Bacteroidia bacterium]
MQKNVSKMIIMSFPDGERKESDDRVEVLVNPDNYTVKSKIKYSEQQAAGTTGKMPKFDRIEPHKMSFDLLFDSTGVINEVEDSSNGIEPALEHFKKVVFEYKGNEHRPRFLTIYWGKLKFDCCLETLDITYKLFRSDGLPLRAVAKAGFIGAVEDTKRVAEEDASSPDLTHVREVKDGDTLPMMAFRIYGDPSYYIEVARANGLNDFRNLETGQEIVFPPLKD